MELVSFLISFFCVAVACYFAVKFSDQMLKDAIAAQAYARVPIIESMHMPREFIMPLRFRAEMQVLDRKDRIPDAYIRRQMIENMLNDLPDDILIIDIISPYEQITPMTPRDRCIEIRNCQIKRAFKYRAEITVVPYRQSKFFEPQTLYHASTTI